MDKLQHIIEQKRELLARETFSRPAINYGEDLSMDEKDRYIHYLVDKYNDADLDRRAMMAVLEDFKAEQKALEEKFSKLESRQSSAEAELVKTKAELAEERKKRKRAESDSIRLREQLKFAQKNKFGDKRQKARVKDGKDKEDEADRNNEKDNYDGTDGTLSTESVSDSQETGTQGQKNKDRDLSGRPEKYNTMRVDGKPAFHPTDDSKVPGRILKRKPVKVFSFKTLLVEEHFEMVQYVEKGKSPKWGYFPTEGHPEIVTKFEGTSATPEFLQALAYEVYVKNVTFGLLHQWLTDMGMTISENTLHNWLKKGKKYLDKLIVVLKSVALEKDSIVNCDETWCKVRKYDHYKKCYIWVLVNKAEKIAIFFYEDGSRGRNVLTDFIGDAELKSIMTDGYNAYVFIGDELKTASLKDTVHQVCMSHARAKFCKAAEQGGDKAALVFTDDMDRLFALERQYNEEGISAEERGRRRQGLETKEILIRLRLNLRKELDEDDSQRTPYLTEALHYLDKFWKEITAYTKDGRYPIDNNIAERAIRPLTTQRNSMLHFGSDEGVEMAATYHSIISTVKLHGSSVWEFLGTFFKKILNGCRDYVNLTPGRIQLATCQC